jgi:hypothetical protein
VFYIACVSTTCFGLCIGHHKVVQFHIIKQTVQCTMFFFVFVDEIPFTSIKYAFKIITVAVELKSYSNIKGINSIKSWALSSTKTKTLYIV